MEFYIPQETGELLAFCAAIVTCLIGIVFLFAPGTAFRVLHIELGEGRNRGYAEARSTLGGFPLGLGLAALLLAQPMVYLALGASFALAAFGRILSMLADKANTRVNWLFLVVQALLSMLPLAYVFGFV